jgi:hypothetical protein
LRIWASAFRRCAWTTAAEAISGPVWCVRGIPIATKAIAVAAAATAPIGRKRRRTRRALLGVEQAAQLAVELRPVLGHVELAQRSAETLVANGVVAHRSDAPSSWSSR